MKVRPLHDKIVVKRIDAPETTKGGIVIPDTAKEKPQEGLLDSGTVNFQLSVTHI